MRCVNIDWLEVSAEEGLSNYPCNADYFRDKGYYVQEREYGTRVWSEMFTIEDREGHPWLEIRRNAFSGDSSFKGLNPQSCRIRLVNAQCYVRDCVERLRVFMLENGYIFKRIYRVDICLDFEFFDYGDAPARFARRYIQNRYRKVNQCHLSAYAQDHWASFEWESLSWGSPHSMVSTKMYNKSLEIKTVSKEKVYIKRAWFDAGLVDDPINFLKVDSHGRKYEPEIWRVEFSMKSKAERWLQIEDQSGKKMAKKMIPHTLDLFDSPDKLWQRFQDLAYHYFRFHIARYKEESKGATSVALAGIRDKSDWSPIRKDLCPEKRLFKFDKDHEFLHIDNCTPARKVDSFDDSLRRKVIAYRNSCGDVKVREACSVLIDALEREALRRLTPKQVYAEVEALRRTLALRMRYPDVDIHETIEEIKTMLFEDQMF